MKKIIYSNQTFDNIEIKSSASDEVVISGYASVFNITDHHNDLIVKGAFANVSNLDVKFLWQHDSKRPIGIIRHLSEDDHGLKMEAVINNKVKAGREAIEANKARSYRWLIYRILHKKNRSTMKLSKECLPKLIFWR